ncbi:MAG: hypothetical protein AAF355_04395 [Myxococcota bacterium]
MMIANVCWGTKKDALWDCGGRGYAAPLLKEKVNASIRITRPTPLNKKRFRDANRTSQGNLLLSAILDAIPEHHCLYHDTQHKGRYTVFYHKPWAAGASAQETIWVIGIGTHKTRDSATYEVLFWADARVKRFSQIKLA